MASGSWQRLLWSKPLFGLLLLNLFWCASFFIAPAILAPGTFAWPYAQYPTVAYHLGAANQLNYEAIWQTLWIYPRAVYTFGDIQCHQLWFRSFYINGNQMPMCARMTSMYVFANVGLVAAAFAQPSTSAGRVMVNALPAWFRRRLARFHPDRAGALIVVVGLLPVAIDGFYQLFSDITHYESTNLMRVLTGAPGGFVGGLLVGAMLISIRQFQMDIARMRAQMPPATP
ncbi:MAG TPA: DUF2085 domain-containing protein [Thermoplasmata archaeon]|nr:DUF2085 domain-containing protein [Thermoplasmata archaeon]